MVDYTRINVSKNGKYLFATEQGELSRESDAKEVFRLLKEKFPESEGYKVSVTKWEGKGYTPEWAKERYFDIHVDFDPDETSFGYSVFVKAYVKDNDEALQYAIQNHLFTEDGDEQYVDYIEEINEDEYHRANGK